MQSGLGVSSLLFGLLVETALVTAEFDQVGVYTQVNACVQSCLDAINIEFASCIFHRSFKVANSAYACAYTPCQHFMAPTRGGVPAYMISKEYCLEYCQKHTISVYATTLTINTHVQTTLVSFLQPPVPQITVKALPITEMQRSSNLDPLILLTSIVFGGIALCIIARSATHISALAKENAETGQRSWLLALTKAFQRPTSSEDIFNYDTRAFEPERCRLTRAGQRRVRNISSEFNRYAYLWSHSKPGLQQLCFVRFDGSCEFSNWIARRIVLRCEAEIEELPMPLMFTTANNGKLWAKEQVRLEFRSARGGNKEPDTHSALFYILPEDSPAEVIVGEEYIVSRGLSNGVVFGIFKGISTQAEKQAEDDNDADNEAVAEDYARARAAVKASEAKHKKSGDKKKATSASPSQAILSDKPNIVPSEAQFEPSPKGKLRTSQPISQSHTATKVEGKALDTVPISPKPDNNTKPSGPLN